MSTKRILQSCAVVLGLSWAIHSSALTDAQKEEFYRKGTITVTDATGKKKGHFEVHFMPGADNIEADAKKAWAAAEERLMELTQRDEFWRKKVLEDFKTGLRLSRKFVCDRGIGAIPQQFRDTAATNSQLSGFGSDSEKLKNWLKFGKTCVSDLNIAFFGGIGGVLYAVTSPTLELLYRPIAAGTGAVVKGTLWPALKFTWNEGVYIRDRNSAEPKEGDMTVTFVPEHLNEADLADEEDGRCSVTPE